MTKKADQKIYPLLVESIDHMKLTPSKKEFARAVLRSAIEYACMRQAGFEMASDRRKKLTGGQGRLRHERTSRHRESLPRGGRHR